MDPQYREECREALEYLLGDLGLVCLACGSEALGATRADEGGSSGDCRCDDCGARMVFDGKTIALAAGARNKKEAP